MLEVDVSGVKHMFSSSVQDMWDSIQDSSSGRLDLLIGANVLSLHPSYYESQGNIGIKRSIFGKGLILTSSHPDN